MNPIHHIKQQTLDTTVKGKSYQEAERLIKQRFYDRWMNEMNTVMNELGPMDRIVHLDKIEIDLGSTNLRELQSGWQDTFQEQFRLVLKEALKKSTIGQMTPIAQDPTQKKSTDLLDHFLENGVLPWWTNRREEKGLMREIERLLETDQPALILLLQNHLSSETRSFRFVNHLDNRLKNDLSEVLINGDPDWFFSSAKQLSSCFHRVVPGRSAPLWELHLFSVGFHLLIRQYSGKTGQKQEFSLSFLKDWIQRAVRLYSMDPGSLVEAFDTHEKIPFLSPQLRRAIHEIIDHLPPSLELNDDMDNKIAVDTKAGPADKLESLPVEPLKEGVHDQPGEAGSPRMMHEKSISSAAGTSEREETLEGAKSPAATGKGRTMSFSATEQEMPGRVERFTFDPASEQMNYESHPLKPASSGSEEPEGEGKAHETSAGNQDPIAAAPHSDQLEGETKSSVGLSDDTPVVKENSVSPSAKVDRQRTEQNGKADLQEFPQNDQPAATAPDGPVDSRIKSEGEKHESSASEEGSIPNQILSGPRMPNPKLDQVSQNLEKQDGQDLSSRPAIPTKDLQQKAFPEKPAPTNQQSPLVSHPLNEQGLQQWKQATPDPRPLRTKAPGSLADRSGENPILAEKEVREGNEFFIGNAGLVLTWPYLNELFKHLKWLDQDGFVGEEQQALAILLLQYMATGNEATSEFDLPLNKVLCAWPMEEPVPVGLTLPTEAKEVGEELLRAITINWAVLKNTTVDGLREAFLIREGKLTGALDGWNLLVEKRGHDLILDQLPWSIRLIRTPWMQSTLFVDW